MKAYIEKNERFGEGYQIRLVARVEDGDREDLVQVWDVQPYELHGAMRRAKKMVEIADQRFGTESDLRDVLVLDREAIKENAKRDITSARAHKMLVENEAQTMLDEGLLDDDVEKVMIYLCLSMDEDDEARRIVMGFCEYVCMRGYKVGGASRAFAEVSGLPKERRAEWVSSRFEKYVNDAEDLEAYLYGR